MISSENKYCYYYTVSKTTIFRKYMYALYSFLYRKNLFMKKKLHKKEQHKLYTLFTIYRSNIVG